MRLSGDWNIASGRLPGPRYDAELFHYWTFDTIYRRVRGSSSRSKIELVVDVRHIPRSRTNPQFNREGLPEQLHCFQIGYVHLASLGGLRNRPRRIETSPNLFWENSSFRNYADYALTEEFHNGLTALRDLGHKQRTVVMCAEAVWWRCHRRIIADYLICAGESVFHILGYDRVDRALLTPGAICQPGGLVSYPTRVGT